METKYYAAVDMGASSGRVMLGWMENGKMQLQEVHRFQNGMVKKDGELCWEHDRIFREVITGLKKCREIGKIPCSVGVDTWGVDFVLLDKEDKPIGNYVGYRDHRTEGMDDEVYKIISLDELYSRTGIQKAIFNTVYQLMAVKKTHPDYLEKAETLLYTPDYFHFLLTGQKVNEYTEATTGQLISAKTNDYDWELIDRLGLDRSLFVPCLEACAPAGRITADCAAQTGLPEGTRVICGGGDTIVQAIGNGVTRPGTMISNIGTSSQIVTIADEPLYDRSFRTNTFNYAKKGQWLIMGANLSGGVSLKWLKNNVIGAEDYEVMDELALKAEPGSGGLLFLPYLSGERTPWNDPDARGIYFGLSLKHAQPELVRSTMEGIIFNQKSSLEIFSEMGISCDQVIASGGGARGPVFRQLEADMFDCEVRTNSINEQGCIGAAIIAAVGCGSFDDYAQACSHIVHLSDEVVEPDPKRHLFYEERYSVFKELYPVTRDLMHRNTK